MAANPLIANYLASQAAPPPGLGAQIAMPSTAPALSAPIMPTAVSNPMLGTQTDKDTAVRDHLLSSGAGVDQVQNPLLRGISKVGDIAASVFAPRLAQFIPGTTLHHQLLVNQATSNLNEDQKADEATAQTAGQTAQTAAITAPNFTPLQTDSGIAAFDHKKGTATPVIGPDGTQVGAPDKSAKPENLQQDYADAVTKAIQGGGDPAHDPKVQQLADAITSLQKQPAAKDPNKDDKYIALNAKLASGQPLTPDETAFKAGYEHYVKVNKIDPAAVRVNAMLQMPQAIVDPNDPSREIYTTRKGAVGQEAPGSGDAQSARKADVYFTTGKGGQTLNAFNTAQNHLQILGQAAEALKNGNSTLLNSAANSFAKATGSPAPTNFDAVKNAVNGEVAKALTGNVTVSEQAELQKDMNSASSPQQIAGIVQKYTQLMQGKKDALHQQYADAKQGNASFESPATAEEYVRDANGKLTKKGGK